MGCQPDLYFQQVILIQFQVKGLALEPDLESFGGQRSIGVGKLDLDGLGLEQRVEVCAFQFHLRSIQSGPDPVECFSSLEKSSARRMNP